MAAVFTFAFPIVFLIVVAARAAGASRVPGTTLRYDQYVVVAMLTFGLISACYTNLAMSICTRRETGVLKRMRGTPIAIGSYLGGLIGSVLIVVTILTVIVVGMGMAFYHLHFPLPPARGGGDPAGRDRDVLLPRPGRHHPGPQRRRRPGRGQRDLPPGGVHLGRLLPARPGVGPGPDRRLVPGLPHDPGAGGGVRARSGDRFRRHDLVVMLVWAAAGLWVTARRFRWEPRRPG